MRVSTEFVCVHACVRACALLRAYNLTTLVLELLPSEGPEKVTVFRSFFGVGDGGGAAAAAELWGCVSVLRNPARRRGQRTELFCA